MPTTNKSETIALYQTNAVFLATLWLVHRNLDLKRITPRGLRELIAAELSERPTLLSTEHALRRANNGIEKFVEQISTGADPTFVIDRRAVEEQFEIYRQVERNLIWRLENIGLFEFKKDLAAARASAERYFALHSLDGRSVGRPLGFKHELDFDFIRGGIRKIGDRPVPVSQRMTKPDWTKWGAVAGWLAILIAVIGIFVTVWLDSK